MGILIEKALFGNNNWLRKAYLEKSIPRYKEKYRDLSNLIRCFFDFSLDFRLTKKRANKLIIRNKLILEERELLLEILINRKEAFAFN